MAKLVYYSKCHWCGHECLNDKGLLYERYRSSVGGVTIIGWKKHYCCRQRFFDGVMITLMILFTVVALPLLIACFKLGAK